MICFSHHNRISHYGVLISNTVFLLSFTLLIIDKLVQLLLSECVEYSRKEHLLDLITLISGMKKCGNSYEVEWISHGSAGLLRPPRMNNKILQSSLAAMFFVTNASLDMTEEESKYTGVHCIACNYCSSGIEMETQRGAFML